MTSTVLSAKEFIDYAQWTASVWLTEERALTPRDYAIMGLGLAGEAGEVIEALHGSVEEGQATHTLRKELGDAVFYCARLADAFNLQVPSCGWSTPQVEPSLVTAHLSATPMFVAVGQVSEVLKKLIRDGVLPDDEDAFCEKLTQGLTAFITAWLVVVAAVGWQPQAVLEANRQKLEDRKIRGVLRGSGNDR